MSLANRARSRIGRPGLPGRIGRFAAGVAKGATAGGRMMGRRRRRRGISATELRGFRKVTRLLKKVGMHPRGLAPRAHRRT